MTTPRGKAREEKRGEYIFAYRFEKWLDDNNIQRPFKLMFEDSNGHRSGVINDVYKMRVLTDRSKPKNPGNAHSPLKKKELEGTGESTSKSDLALVDSQGNDIAWISHKYHKDADEKVKDSHAQYMHVGTNKKLKYEDAYEDVQVFKRKMLEWSIQTGDDPTQLCWPIRNDKIALYMWDNVKSKNLIGIAIFGVRYGDAKYGRQNCNVILYGDPVVRMENGIVILSSHKESIVNGFIPDKFNDDKQTVIFMTMNDAASKTTVIKNGKTYAIDGVGIWIVYKGKKSTEAIQIDDMTKLSRVVSKDICRGKRVSKNKKEEEQIKETRTNKKEDQIKGTRTNIKHDGYDVYFDDKLENPYAAFYYIDNLKKIKKIDYSTIKNNPTYLKVLQQYNKNKIPSGKMINPKTGRFVKGNPVKSLPITAFLKPFRSSPSRSSTNTSPLISAISPRQLQGLYSRPSMKTARSSTPTKSPTPTRSSTPTKSPTPIRSSTPTKSSTPVKSMANINTGFYHISKLDTREIKSKIHYIPLKKKFYYILPDGRKKLILNTDIHKYIPENRLKNFI
jgi:hypothetical protein